MKTFEFAKYTEVTDVAFELNPDYKKEGYVRFFICPDVWDTWLIRVLKDYNENYEREDGCYLIERNNIDNDNKGQEMTMRRLREIIEDDDGSCWDTAITYSMDDVIDTVSDGFGINDLES